MTWALGLLVLLVALSIPIIAIVLHSPYARAMATRSGPEEEDRLEALTRRVLALEDDVDELGRALQELRDETLFLQSLLQRSDEPPPLPPRQP
jgi:hypothetical protein